MTRAQDNRFASEVRSHRLLENRVRLWKSLWCSSFIVDEVSVQLTQVGSEVEPQICNPTQLGIEQLSLAAHGVNPAPKLLAETTSLAIWELQFSVISIA